MGSSTWQILLNGVFSGSTYVIVATGFFFIYRSARFFDLSYAAILSVGAFSTYALIHFLSIPIIVAVAVGAMISSVFAAIFETTAYRALRKMGATSPVRLLASIGIMIVVFNTISVIFGDAPVLTINTPPKSIAIGGAYITVLRVVTFVAAICLSVICWVLLGRTRWGLQQSALFDDLGLARCIGVDENIVTLSGVMIGAGVGGVAAALLAIDGSIRPGMGFDLVLPAVIAATAAGFRRLEIAIFFAFMVGICEQAFGWYFAVAWQEVFVACLLVITLVVAPRRPDTKMGIQKVI